MKRRKIYLNEIKVGNAAIARFMGAYKKRRNQRLYTMDNGFPDGSKELLPEQMKYHLQWKWLSPVCSKSFEVDEEMDDKYSYKGPRNANPDIQSEWRGLVREFDWMQWVTYHENESSFNSKKEAIEFAKKKSNEIRGYFFILQLDTPTHLLVSPSCCSFPVYCAKQVAACINGEEVDMSKILKKYERTKI